MEGARSILRSRGFRRVRLEESSNPEPPRTRARARMEQEAKAVAALTCLEVAVTRIDDSSDDEPFPTWRDEVSESEEMGRVADVKNVLARVLVMWRITQPSHNNVGFTGAGSVQG